MEITWPKIVTKVEKCTFRVYAGNSAGTGFLVSVAFSEKEGMHYALIATAWHVLSGLDKAKDNLRLVSANKKKVLDNKKSDIDFIMLDTEAHDTGLIIVKTDQALVSEAELLPIPPKELMLAQGAEIAG